MNTELVFYHNIKDEPYTTVSIISELTGIHRRTIMQTIYRNQKELEEVGGVLRHQIAKPSNKGGRPFKEYMPNEPQATLLMTMLENSNATVKRFKVELVKSFFEVKKELAEKRILLERNHQTNKDLGEVIKEHFPEWPQAYSTFHNLAYKVAIGMTPKQVKQARNVTNAQEALTAEELDKVERYRTIIANLIELGMDYQQIKQQLTPITQ